VLLQLAVLIVWTLLDPVTAILHVTDELNLIAEWKCQANYPTVWLSIEIVLFGLMLLWGIYVVYATWSVKESLRESRWLLISIYNLMLVLSVIVPLLNTLSWNDEGLFYLAVPCIIFSSANILLSVFVPVMKSIVSVFSSGTDFSTERKKNSRSEKSSAEYSRKRTQHELEEQNKKEGEQGREVDMEKEKQREKEKHERHRSRDKEHNKHKSKEKDIDNEKEREKESEKDEKNGVQLPEMKEEKEKEDEDDDRERSKSTEIELQKEQENEPEQEKEEPKKEKTVKIVVDDDKEDD